MTQLEKRKKVILNKSEYTNPTTGKTTFTYGVLTEDWKDKKMIGYKGIAVKSEEEYNLLDEIYIIWQRTEFGGYYRTLTKEEIEKELESEDLPFSVELPDEK